MIARRQLLIAALGLGAAGAAEALRPRRKLKLLRSGTIAQTIPTKFGQWSAEDSSGLVSPEQAGQLARTLYSEIVERTYHSENGDAAVMLLAAYGDTQSDLLQLHRPESCYPAVGFTIMSSTAANLPLGGAALLPARRVVATTADRTENIFYWTRIGETLPQSAADQRGARLANAFHGYVGDGILMRCSAIGAPEPSFKVLNAFVPQMLEAVGRGQRPALIGSRLTQEMPV